MMQADMRRCNPQMMNYIGLHLLKLACMTIKRLLNLTQQLKSSVPLSSKVLVCVSSLTTLTNLMSSATKILHVHGDSASHVTPQKPSKRSLPLYQSQGQRQYYSHLTLSSTVSLITSARPLESRASFEASQVYFPLSVVRTELKRITLLPEDFCKKQNKNQ